MQRSIQQISDLFRQGSLSPVELTEDCLARIEKQNPRLNAFITVTAESARAQARTAEGEIRRGDWRGPLHGVPLALKDLIDTAGVRTTAASAMFRDRIPSEDAEVVRRLKEAGAVLLGKQNLHEFAYGGSSMVSYFGEVRNAWNTEHITGRSSGGSATAVAAGLGFGALGTDTAGSVREPAALCGVVGRSQPTGESAPAALSRCPCPSITWGQSLGRSRTPQLFFRRLRASMRMMRQIKMRRVWTFPLKTISRNWAKRDASENRRAEKILL